MEPYILNHPKPLGYPYGALTRIPHKGRLKRTLTWSLKVCKPLRRAGACQQTLNPKPFGPGNPSDGVGQDTTPP